MSGGEWNIIDHGMIETIIDVPNWNIPNPGAGENWGKRTSKDRGADDATQAMRP